MNYKLSSLHTLLWFCAAVASRHTPFQKRQNGTCLPAPPAPEPYTAETQYLSCYTDQDDPRTLAAVEYVSSLNTPQYCADTCGDAGYSLAGVEYRSQCFCANSISSVASPANESSCNYSCPGDASQICGQTYFMNIYNITNPNPNPPKPISYFPDCTLDPLCSMDICNLDLSAAERAAALVSAFTVDEKIANLVNTAPGVPRLGLAPYQWWSEGLHGLASSPGVSYGSTNFTSSTSFPSPIVIGSAFDDDMVRAIAEVIGTEARAFDNDARAGLDLWTPNINPFKDPRWGRGQETPGEDPFHLQSYVASLISGLEDSSTGYKKIIATCKHYAAYDFEGNAEVDRHGFDAIVTTQELSEYYLPSFKTCAAELQVGAFMCSYNSINGVPACASSYFLEDILRQHWQWEADYHWVTSDCDAVQDIYGSHHYASTNAEAAADALKAGTDLECINSPWDGLTQAFNASLINEQDLDKALIRLYTSLIDLGFFNPATNQTLRLLGWDAVNTPTAQQLAHDSAVEGLVLIKNDGVLPLGVDTSKLYAIIGPYYEATTQLQGNYYGRAPYLISPLQAAQNLGLNVVSAMGSGINATDTTYADAIQAAQSADTIIFFGGIDTTIEGEALDRTSIVWPEPQLDLLRQLTTLKKPVVVVQFGGGQIDDLELLANSSVNSILWAGYPGQSGGAAIFDVLTGSAAPAGRLPITQYPSSYVDAVSPLDMNLRPASGNSNLGRTHMWYVDEPVVPFGHGLHYTTFDVSIDISSNASYSIADLTSGSSDWIQLLSSTALTVPVTIHNTGSVESDFVALLFLNSTVGPAPYPSKTLTSYKRAHKIQPGSSVQLDLPVKVESLTRVDDTGSRALYPGDYTFFVDIDRKASLQVHLTGNYSMVEEFPQIS